MKDRFPCDDVHRPKRKIIRETISIDKTLETTITTIIKIKEDDKPRTNASE